DKKIQAAAADGDGDNDDRDEHDPDYEDGDDDKKVNDDEAGDEFGDEDDEDGDDKNMSKSFQLTLDDGSVVEAEDGTALVKALLSRVEKNEETLAKALEATVRLIKSQGETIRS